MFLCLYSREQVRPETIIPNPSLDAAGKTSRCFGVRRHLLALPEDENEQTRRPLQPGNRRWHAAFEMLRERRRSELSLRQPTDAPERFGTL